MLEELKSWKGTAEVDGKQYTNIADALSHVKADNGVIYIKLFPTALKGQESRPDPVASVPTEHSTKVVAVDSMIADKEYTITVKKYMTETATASFDFMEKWNNNKPMPLRTMTGEVLQQTKGMVKMRLHGVGKAEIHCMRCGRELTNPISRHYGIGPECMQKVGFIGLAIDDVDLIKERLTNLVWEGWVIKSAITSCEEET